jgi:hypothetical protein
VGAYFEGYKLQVSANEALKQILVSSWMKGMLRCDILAVVNINITTFKKAMQCSWYAGPNLLIPSSG